MVRKLSFFGLFVMLCAQLSAQDKAATPSAPYRSLSPDDKWELGINLGLPFVDGDVDPKFPGIGAGLHLRKSLDHVFSVRGNFNYLSTKSEGEGSGSEVPEASNTWLSGSAQIVAALNNIRYNKPYRKILVNGYLGVGFHNMHVDASNISQADGTTNLDKKFTSTHLEIGAEAAFRINQNMNFALGWRVFSPFGKSSDLLDGDENVRSTVTTFRDNMHYPYVGLNFNLGGKSKDGADKSEPIYWVNPMGKVADAITALEARPIYDPTDTDKDGIIDAIDDEDNSPAGARVDSRGVSLDSDGDKVPDYKDKEPYTAPAYVNNVDANGIGRAPKPITEEDVNRIVDAKIAAIKLPEPPKGLNNWFLPIVNFGDNRYDVGVSEYEKLYQIASVLKANSDIKVVATGYTDTRGSEGYNNVLSFNRAKAAIEFMVATHGISRDRLLLNFGGETAPLVPGTSSRQNRRVESRVAKAGDKDMTRPEGPEAGKGRFKGNTGY
jgi:OmpA-OmpF porin, OOP family